MKIDKYFHLYGRKDDVVFEEIPAPSAQPDIARDIATIIENEQDMRVIARNAQPEIIRCKDCKHKPRIASETGDVGDGFDIEFPDEKCPCQCSDGYYNWMPYDDWFCGNGERRTDE